MHTSLQWIITELPLQWRHNEHDGVANYRRLYCLLNHLFRCRSKKHQSSVSLACVRGIHRWPVTSPHKGASNAENVSIWWRHHATNRCQEICNSHADNTESQSDYGITWIISCCIHIALQPISWSGQYYVCNCIILPHHNDSLFA